MKMIKSFILLFCLMLGASCTLDLQEDPNAVQPSQALPSLVLNSMQRNLAGLFQGTSSQGMLLTRLQNSGGTTYFNIFSPQSFDGTWSTAYASILQDGATLNAIADDPKNGMARHAGMSRVISAYAMFLLVDMFGDVPYTSALKGAGDLNPSVDQGADVYTAALALLDRAKLDLATPTVANGGYLNATAPAITDLYYNNDYTRWIRLANTLKLKAYLAMRMSDPAGATAGINAAIADPGGLIVAQDQNFVFRYGTSLTDPDARHPRFVANYPGGGGNYMSDYLMWQLFNGYGATQNGQPGDPRMRFYFYRQTNANTSLAAENSCISFAIPAHYPQSTGGGSAISYNPAAGAPPGITSVPSNQAWTRTFCFPTDRGYWGRDHVDGGGIPPDGFLRTAWGVYPAGGKFDANNPTGVSAANGMQGAGFQPIMMRSFVQFMLSESALYLGTTGVARTHFQNGIQYSMDDVRSWAVSGTFGVGGASPVETTIAAFYPDIAGASATAAVRAASTANIAALNGLLTIDGVTLLAGDRVLVKNQTTQTNNGIYDVGAGAWTRSAASSTGGQLSVQATSVLEGNVNIGTNWVQSVASPTLGTTNLVYTGSYGLDVSNYITRALASYDAQIGNANIMNYIAREYWVALFGNGVEAYNLYRRTGMPTGMQPTIVATTAASPFIRSFWYPNNFAVLNSKVEQKADLTGRIFWDKNTSNLDF